MHHGITLCTGSLGCSKKNDVAAMAYKYSKMGRIHFAHLRNVKILENGFEETAHPSDCGSLDMYAIVKALCDGGFDGYVRPDHGRMIWEEVGRPGYGLYDRALGAAYINGLFEACMKNKKQNLSTCFEAVIRQRQKEVNKEQISYNIRIRKECIT